MATGTLVDVTRMYGPFIRTFLIDLKKKYDVQLNLTVVALTPECDAEWVRLLKETYEAAWFVLLVAASAISVVTFAIGFSRSSSWRWFARLVGAIAFFTTTGAAIYSLGEVGWHVVGFSDFWSAFQVVTGYRFNSVVVELLSALLSAYASWTLVKA